MLSIDKRQKEYINSLYFFYTDILTTNSDVVSIFSNNVSNDVKKTTKNINDKLVFDKKYNKRGKQGMVGLLYNNRGNDGENKEKFMFKVSQQIDYIINHEHVIMKALDGLSPYLPHFCKLYGMAKCLIEPKIRKKGDPFIKNNVEKGIEKNNIQKGIEKDVLFFEYIDGEMLSNFITNEDIEDDAIISIIKQTLLAVIIAQKEKKFSHYDLHSDNIMVKTCNKNAIFVYVLDDDNVFAVPTYGYYPVIIDYGYSYIDGMVGRPFYNTLAHTDVGFLTDRYDMFADPKLFLITFSLEMLTYRGSKKWKKLENIVKNIFSPLDIQWDSGWDNEKYKSCTEILIELVENIASSSDVVSNYINYVIDMFFSMITLPLKKRDDKIVDDIGVYFKSFVTEFSKIEKEISSEFYLLYILKIIIDSCRNNRDLYFSDKDTKLNNKNTPKKIRQYNKGKAIQNFTRDILNGVDNVIKFYNPDINYEKLFLSIILFSNSCEGIMYMVMQNIANRKEKEYKKLEIESVEEIYGIIDVNLPSDYTFTDEDEIVIMNVPKKKMHSLHYISENGELSDKLDTETVEILNTSSNLSWGSIIYSLQKNSDFCVTENDKVGKEYEAGKEYKPGESNRTNIKLESSVEE